VAVNYDDRLYKVYVQGRALNDQQYAAWAAAFVRHLPATRPLRGLDVGSGTGRFTPFLADLFGGPVSGVEPSERMREIAQQTVYPGVRYLKGNAESIPLADDSADFALLFLVWHHVADKAAAARELLRVVRPGGTLLLRSQFSDRMPDLWWLDAFPRGRDIYAGLYQPLDDVLATFSAAGWEFATLDEVSEASPGSRVARLAKLKTRSLSLFEHFTEEEIEAGFAELERRIRADPDLPIPPAASDLVVLRAT